MTASFPAFLSPRTTQEHSEKGSHVHQADDRAAPLLFLHPRPQALGLAGLSHPFFTRKLFHPLPSFQYLLNANESSGKKLLLYDWSALCLLLYFLGGPTWAGFTPQASLLVDVESGLRCSGHESVLIESLDTHTHVGPGILTASRGVASLNVNVTEGGCASCT